MANIETGKLICELRKMKNMTQKDLANYLNVSDKAVSKWERGESYPEITILPQLSSILEITVDELLEGKRQNTVPEVENEQEKNYAYACLLEDANNKFKQNTVISFFIISIGLLVRTLGYSYSVLLAVVIGICGGGFYLFTLNKYRISQDRILRYNDLNNDKNEIYYNIKHSKLFIGITIFLLSVDSIIDLIGFKTMKFYTYHINGRNLSINYWCSNIGYFILLTAIIANLYIYYSFKNNNMNLKLLESQNQVRSTTFLSSLVSLLLSWGITICKIAYVIMDSYTSLKVNALTGVIVFIVIGINVFLFKKYYRNRKNVFWAGLTSGTIQFVLLNYISSKSIFYYASKSNINLGQIQVYMLVIAAAICTITIYYVTNFLILRSEAGKINKVPGTMENT